MSAAAPGGWRRRGLGLIGEIGLLMAAASAACVILVENFALQSISRTMEADLQAEAERTAEETVAMLEFPLYTFDEDQCRRIGQTLLASGSISGISLVSSAGRVIMNVPTSDQSSSIESISGSIFHEELPLGAYRLDFSDRKIRDIHEKIESVILWAIVAVILSIALAIRFILVVRIDRAFAPVVRTLARIREGDYAARIPESRHPDLNRLVVSINAMADKIEEHRDALKRANQDLEVTVAARTEALSASLAELERTQGLLVQSERLSVLGNLSAGIAHELNTPLGAILASDRILLDFFGQDFAKILRTLAGLDERGRERFFELYELAKSAVDAPDRPRSERMLRKRVREELSARGVGRAEEVADRLAEAGLLAAVDRIGPWLSEPDAPSLIGLAAPAVRALRMAEVVDMAGGKAAAAVGALRSYVAQQGSDDPRYLDLESELDKTLRLMRSQLEHRVEVVKRYRGIEVPGSPEKLGQVWINIVRNAAQAMEFRGTLTIETSLADDGTARVSIADTGPGIPEEARSRIFEPFFTTKRHGEGMGIGLDISRRIVQSHGGSIDFESGDGRTVFTVSLPNGRPKA